MTAPLLASWLVLAAGLEPPHPEAVAFFERRVRPVLAENCVRCHGPKKQQAGLRLDSGEAVLKGGDHGPAIVPGAPEKSLLMQAVRHQGDLEMPPDGELPAAAVVDLVAWVKMGAPWPASPAANAATTDASPSTHWAFRNPADPPVPEVKDRSWPVTTVDRFILARLEREGLTPSPEADRRTLIRRATFDLHGLPPTPEEVEAFAADESAGAYDRLIDRLLDSPRYGERWGRHWLDVARYSDTKGYIYEDREQPRYPFAYTYRDYVIRSFNDDLPYDRFVIEQLAADRLRDRRPGSVAALGFLTLGRRFANSTHDVIDDRIDVVSRGLLGLTVTCSRCHDHKFDPIPTTDYYALYGIFAACTERVERLDPAAAPIGGSAGYVRELRKREAALAARLELERTKLSDQVRKMSGAYLAAVLVAEKLPGDDFYVILSADDVNPVLARRWQSYLLGTRKAFHPIFGVWNALTGLPDADFAARAPEVLRRLIGDPSRPVNRRVARAFEDPPPSRREVAERYGRLLRAAFDAKPDEVAADRSLAELRDVLYAPGSPAVVPPIGLNEVEAFFDEKARVELGKLQIQVDKAHLEDPAAIPAAHALADAPEIRPQFVFLRGNPKRKGPEVSRRFLTVLSAAPPRPFTEGSGRLELARAIASPANPLTARVFVNRVWQWHFGCGLVATASDFGLRSDPPTHPELLDHLAGRFVAAGWSVKALHRLIMRSRAYRQASADRPECRRRDPENRLVWRANRRRLDFESFRDSILFVSGDLDPRPGGRPFDLTDPGASPRRTVYGLVDRISLPGVLRAFDFANPDAHSPGRFATTVPQQALYLLNGAFVRGQAEVLLRLIDVAAVTDPGARIERLYRRIYQRSPTPAQRELALRFLAGTPASEPPASAWRRYVQALLMANEFILID
jgi:hypothetical protein